MTQDRTAEHSQASEEAPEYAKGCECDSCCRLSELAVVFGLSDSCDTADEIAGMVKKIHEGMEEQVAASWERDRVSRERTRQALERAAKIAEDEDRAFVESSRRMDAAKRFQTGTSEINAALACRTIAEAILALLSDGESASAGKEE